ncbi:hypothetical protein [Methylobacterium sp. E-066]|uniref:hypothetical protein n=1 Tax=Methylobacterium sp. E-066 TaxID=2836584 RepID=UPI001FB97E80|nr:hypothetical protein [Methylobacterium sp. E-066]MCJ2142463.1 hypothetical protein [Methylobacterium sp. E-066]
MRRLVVEALPPLTLPTTAPCRTRQTNPMPRLKRLLCVLAALALPALGITVADTVHRAGETRASQAAAPAIPPDGAAAASGPVTLARADRTAALTLIAAEARS